MWGFAKTLVEWAKTPKGGTPLADIRGILAETSIGGVVPPAAIFILGTPGSGKIHFVSCLAKAAKDAGVAMAISNDVAPVRPLGLTPGGCCESHLENPVPGIGVAAARIVVVACRDRLSPKWGEALAAAGFNVQGVEERAAKLRSKAQITGELPFLVFRRSGEPSVLTLEKAQINLFAVSDRRNCDLIEASRMGSADAMKKLLAAGADVRAVDKGRTALHNAAGHGRPEAVAILVSAGADMEARTAYEWRTPLHLAAGHHESRDFAKGCLEALLAAGADPNARAGDGETPLHRASRAGNAEEAVALFRAGADTGAVNDLGQTPADAARESQNGHVTAAIEAAILSAETKGSRSAGKARRI